MDGKTTLKSLPPASPGLAPGSLHGSAPNAETPEPTDLNPNKEDEMTDDYFPEWPLRPSQSASVAYQLCMALNDAILHEGSGGMPRRAYLKLCGLGMAAELFSREAAQWFASRTGEDEVVLEGLEEKYVVMARGYRE